MALNDTYVVNPVRAYPRYYTATETSERRQVKGPSIVYGRHLAQFKDKLHQQPPGDLYGYGYGALSRLRQIKAL